MSDGEQEPLDLTEASLIERTLTGGGGMLIARGASKFLGLLFVLAGGGLLGAEEFGVLALSLSVVTIAQKVSAFGLPTTIQRVMSGSYDAETESTYFVILVVGGAGAVVGASLLFLMAPGLSRQIFDAPSIEAPLRILALWLVCMVGVALTRAVLQAQERVNHIILLDVVERGGKVALLAIGVVLIDTSVMGAWAVAASGGLALALGLKLVAGLELRPAVAVGRRHLRQVFRYSLPFAIVGFSYLLARHADRLMLGMLAESADVGVYTVCSSVAMASVMVDGSLVSIFKPVASSAHRNDQLDTLGAAYRSVGKWSGATAAVLLMLFVGGGREALSLVGPQYGSVAAYWTLVVLGALYFVGTWVGPAGAVLQMAEGHRLELVNTVVFVVLNVGLNFYLIPQFGMLGAAVATFVSGLIRNLLQIAELMFLWKFNVFSRSQVLFGMLVTVSFGLATVVGDSFWRVLVSGLAVLAVAVTTIGRMTDQEWGLVYDLRLKLRKMACLE